MIFIPVFALALPLVVAFLRIFRNHRNSIMLALMTCGVCNLATAQASVAPAPRPLITHPVDESQRTILKGNLHPLARPEFDRGLAPASLPMRRMILVLQHSSDQESALLDLLDGQQTKSAPNYRQWLTPEQFGKQFGASDSDVAAIQAWLESHGFQVAGLSKGRTAIEFSGTAAQVQEAFRTEIHSYQVNGEQHWANSGDPSIPSSLAPAVKGVLTLHNFPRRFHSTAQGALQASPSPSPLFTFTSGTKTYYGLGPADFATIYNLLPLWNAGIDGTGQTIAIVGETNIHISDIETFRSLFALPAKDPQIILNGPDPGVVGDEPEAVLDVSWSGAVAKNATIDLVVSASTESSLGVDLSALYIVDNNLAPVMSESYGECEATLGSAGNAFYNALWQQAAAQGITVVVSAGDGGPAGCDNFDSAPYASKGLAVSGFASTPYNVAVGGTDFDQTPTTAPTYWSATNNSTTAASALGYIPEVPWNQSCAALGPNQCPTSSSGLDIVAGSGGPSSCSTQTSSGACHAGYSKPAWQTGTGVPADGVRDLPDVSLFASAGFNGSFYIVCELDAGIFGSPLPCSLTNDTFLGIGGTSASAPAFAGMMALVNQKQGARQGNANYVLYKLAAQSGATCNSSTASPTGNACIFYDIAKGSNSVPCAPNSPNCGAAPTNGYGVLVDPKNPATPAWQATPGYDMATGLGTLNAANLVNAWSAATFTPSTTTLANLSPVSLAHGQPVNVSVTVAPKSGSGTPTGSVSLMAAPPGKTVGIDNFPLTNGAASGVTNLLPGGTYNVTAHYAGDAAFGASDSAPIQVTVGKENSQTKASLIAYNPTNGTFKPVITIPYGSIFFLRGDVANAAGAPCAPNPQQTEVTCPSGSMSFTSNGKSLDAGSYTLNTQGYAEDQTLAPEFTALGSYSLQAQYSGDLSYNSSASTVNATVTQAPTMMYVLGTTLGLNLGQNGVYASAYSGQSFVIDTSASADSVLQAPTGTIAFTENGGPPSGVVTYTPTNGSFIGNYSSGTISWAYLTGNLTMSIDTPGNYVFNASYGGDSFYTGSQVPFPLTVTVLDTTYNIATPIPNITIVAGQSGVATVTLASVDSYNGTVKLTCTLPAAMTEATCLPATANIASATATAQLTITTTAAHTVAANHPPAKGLYGFGALACVLLFVLPGRRRRRFPLALLLFVALAGFGACGGGGGSSAASTSQDAGTPAGTYTVQVTALSSGITRTASFNVTVQ